MARKETNGTSDLKGEINMKRWYKSKTVWVNTGILVLTIAETQFSFLQPMLPVNIYAMIAFSLPIVNGILRTITSSALTK